MNVAAARHFDLCRYDFTAPIACRGQNTVLFHDKPMDAIADILTAPIDPSRQAVGTVQNSVAGYEPDPVGFPVKCNELDSILLVPDPVAIRKRASQLTAQ